MELRIETTMGTIEGFASDGIRKFLGFPYAAPPIGERRFRAAQPLEKHSGIIRADAYKAKCPQLQIPVVPDNGLPQSEDCLYMNVWAPAKCKKAPVLFWTYGGAFASGEGSVDTYDGTKLVKQGDVIVVTYNYRVGIFGGFYPLDHYTEKDAFTPNAGLSDVLCALRFVHDNIEAFGGDPGNITIAGESAGAVITALLAGTQELQGMFSKVILESFVDMDKFGQPGRKPAEEFLAAAEVKDASELLSWDTGALLDAQAKICGGNPAMAGCRPVPDAKLLSAPIWGRIAQNMTGKGLLIGTNRDEAAVFVPPELMGTPQGEAMKVDMTKSVFEAPTHLLMDAAAAHNLVFAYRFDYAPLAFRQNGMGAFHSAEMDYVFGNLTPAVSGSEEEAHRVSQRMMSAWLSFIRSGDPGWASYSPDTPQILHFDAVPPSN